MTQLIAKSHTVIIETNDQSCILAQFCQVFIGFVAAFVIGADKLWCLANHIPQRLVTDSPYFYIALTMMMIGTQLFLTGFIGDLISRSSVNRNDYQVEREI